jgi:hypothetical protein
MNIGIEDVKTDLERVTYSFYIRDYKFILDSYKVQYRESKRHKWKNLKSYERLFSRQNTIKLSEFEIPLFIQIEVKERFKDMLVVLKEDVL